MNPNEDPPASDGEDSRIEALLDRYYFLLEQGESPTIDEVCREAPELKGRLERLVTAQSDLLGATIGSDTAEVEIPPAPEQVGPYRIAEQLGSGGMGVVYRASDVDGHEIALKILRPELAADPSRRLRFRREARITAALEHPHIVPVVDTGIADGHCFLAMRLLDGATLDQQPGNLDEREAARLGAKIARALHSAHEVGVVHRDVKPSNILLEHGEPFLLDFGLARNRLDWALTRDGHMPGTLAYMAPEQLRGDNEQIGPRADVYALGATLHQLVAGSPPFDDSTPEALMRSVLVDRPRLGRRTGHHPAFARIVEKALEKDPRDRFESAEAFAEELDRFASGSSILTRSRPWRLRVRRQFRRHPIALTLAASAVVVITWLGAQRAIDNSRRAADYEQRIAAIQVDLEEGRHHQALVRLGDLDIEDTVLDRRLVEDLRARALGARALDQLWDMLLSERKERNDLTIQATLHRLRSVSEEIASSPEGRLAAAFATHLTTSESRTELGPQALAAFDDATGGEHYPLTRILALSRGSEPSDGGFSDGDAVDPSADDLVFSALLRQILDDPVASIRPEVDASLAIDPTHRRANLLSAHLLNREGNLAGARSAMQSLLREDDPRPEMMLHLAYISMRIPDLEGASLWIDRAREAFAEIGQPSEQRLVVAEARVAVKARKLRLADEHLAKARELGPVTATIELTTAQIAALRGQYDLAFEAIERMQSLASDDYTRKRGEVLLLDMDAVRFSAGNPREGVDADSLCRRLLALADELEISGDLIALGKIERLRSQIARSVGRTDEAEAARDRAYRANPLDPKIVALFMAGLDQLQRPLPNAQRREVTEALQAIQSWFDRREQMAEGRLSPRTYELAVSGAFLACLLEDSETRAAMITHARKASSQASSAQEWHRWYYRRLARGCVD